MENILYFWGNQRNLHYVKVQKVTNCADNGATRFIRESHQQRYLWGHGDTSGKCAIVGGRVRRPKTEEGYCDCGDAPYNTSGSPQHQAAFFGQGRNFRHTAGDRYSPEAERHPTCSGEVYRRCGGEDNSDSLQHTSRRFWKMDPTNDFGKSGGVRDNRLHIPHPSGTHTKKNEFKPHLKKMWCIPPEQNAAFVAAMEDVLEVYSRPYNPKMPVVCMDEQPIELHSDSRDKIALSKENHTEKVDHEYVRHGTCCGFMFTEPLGGWRRVDIKESRCKVDWAEQIKQLVDVDFPDAEKIVLVCDNLNTHNISSLYEAFEPSEARRIWERLELHHTPKHGSWLDMAEIELSAFTKGCLNRRLGTMEEVDKESKAWYQDRNKRQKGIDWQFSIGDARIKLKHLYPIIKTVD